MNAAVCFPQVPRSNVYFWVTAYATNPTRGGSIKDKTVPCRTQLSVRAHVQLNLRAERYDAGSLRLLRLLGCQGSASMVACDGMWKRTHRRNHRAGSQGCQGTADGAISDSMIRIWTEESRADSDESDLSSRSRCSRVAWLIHGLLHRAPRAFWRTSL